MKFPVTVSVYDNHHGGRSIPWATFLTQEALDAAVAEEDKKLQAWIDEPGDPEAAHGVFIEGCDVYAHDAEGLDWYNLPDEVWMPA